ncbi:MAG: hypothetical protein WAW96_03575 [Alphaproteobacteria bacterium]
MTTLRNEQDVREELATPFLKSLGYAVGTSNDISREHHLRYDRLQLGRKKPNDAPLPLGGKADYLLTVAGAGRWILETKPPDEEITVDDIDQAISYARHPEVAGYYAAVLNGSRFVLYHITQTSNEAPRANLSVTSGEDLARTLQGILGPLAIRRDCTPPKVDLRFPLAPGLRGEADITGGWNKHLANEVEAWPSVIAASLDDFRSRCAMLVGTQSTVKSGRIWRDDATRIRARLSWHSPHQAMKPMLEEAHLDDFEHVCLDTSISIDPQKPSVFEILGSYKLREGQASYDLLQWKTQQLGRDVSVVIQGQATGFLSGSDFSGLADYRHISHVSGIPGPIVVRFLTEFSFTIDSR